MAENKSILDINIDDIKPLKEAVSLIGQLTKLTQEYNDKFGKNGGIKLPVSNYKSSDKEKDEGGNFLKNIDKQNQSVNKTFKAINSTLGRTTGLLKNLFTSTISWGTKISLLAGGGAFGYGFAASKVANNYANAQGINVSTGTLKAAKNVYGNRLGDIEGILGLLSTAKSNNLSDQSIAVRSAGLNINDDPRENLPKILKWLSRRDYTQTLPGGLSNYIDVNTHNRIRANANDLDSLGQQFKTQSRVLNLSDESQRSFQSTDTTFSNSADKVVNAFLQNVSRLNKPIGQVADKLADAAVKFMNGPNGQAVFDFVADGLAKFGNWISGPKFQKDLTDFGKAVSDIVGAIGSAARFINGLFGFGDKSGVVNELEQKSSFTDKSENRQRDGSFSGFASAVGKTFYGLGNAIFGSEENELQRQGSGSIFDNPAYGQIKPKTSKKLDFWLNNNQFSGLENQYGLPSGLLPTVRWFESGGNDNAISRDKDGNPIAHGPFQFRPSTAADYGLHGNDIYDPQKSSVASAKHLAMLFKMYNNDPVKAIGAYNWGQGNVNKYGIENAPKETRDYLAKILPVIGANRDLERYETARKTGTKYIPQGWGSNPRIQLDVNQQPGSDIQIQANGISGFPVAMNN